MTDSNIQSGDEMIPSLDEDLDPERPADAGTTEVQQPAIVAGVGSSALGSVDIEPQRDYPPDNDGESVEE